MHSEEDLKHASQFRDGIHEEALTKVKAVFPRADHVVDKYPVDAYFQEVWDYPGKWYTMVGTPPGAGSRKDLIGAIVRDTLAYYRSAGADYSEAAFARLMGEYPDLVCKYCLITEEDPSAKADGVFPYRGANSHRLALQSAAETLFPNGKEERYDINAAKCRKLSGKGLFAPVSSDEFLNYRKAFLCLARRNSYTDDDFERVNAVLFPGGAEGLEAYRWTTDWWAFFDSGSESRGALCLTVYDRAMNRFVVILASTE